MRLFVRLSPDYTILIKFVTWRELYNTPHVYHVSCELGSMAVQYWQLPCAEPENGFLRNSEPQIYCGLRPVGALALFKTTRQQEYDPYSVAVGVQK